MWYMNISFVILTINEHIFCYSDHMLNEHTSVTQTMNISSVTQTMIFSVQTVSFLYILN